ncbi:glycosyltransferase family 4 protein [Methanolobus sp. WCC4]|uniref:glycosyltransferase family 4 protein n=1 Tax=Methanolobus sp. WCC4 TaxID=3125784 RepID=UPI0030F9A867
MHSRTGDAIHVSELSMNLAALENKVSLLASFDSPSNNDLNFLTNNKNVILVPFIRSKGKYFKSRNLSLLLQCFKLAKEAHPDIIYERNFSCKIGSILSFLLGIPLIVEINGVMDEEMLLKNGFIFRKKAIVSNWLKKIFYRSASTIIAVSPMIKEKMIDTYHIESSKVEVVPNGADVDLFSPLDKNIARRKLGLDSNLKYLCFVGNLASWQGLDFLVSSAPFILEQEPDIRFLIVGDGVMRNELESMTNDNNTVDMFVFTGNVPFKDVPLYINSSDICIALFNEGRKCSPLKVFEYLACGKPVIITDLGGDTEIFRGIDSVFFLESRQPKSLADLISHVLPHVDNQKRVIEARNFIVEKYAWENTAQRVVDICNKAMRNKY